MIRTNANDSYRDIYFRQSIFNASTVPADIMGIERQKQFKITMSIEAIDKFISLVIYIGRSSKVSHFFQTLILLLYFEGNISPVKW